MNENSFEQIPHGTFESISQEELNGMVFSVKIGRKLQVEYPTIADDYRSGLSINSIIERYNITEKYGIKIKTAENAVRYALRGYDGSISITEEDVYPGLILDKDELLNIAHIHNVDASKKIGERMKGEGRGIFGMSKKEVAEAGKKSGNLQFKNGIGIHAQTIEEHREMGKKIAESQNKIVFSDEEIEFIRTKITDPDYQRGTRINVKKIAELLNESFFDGCEVRTATSVKKICSRFGLKNKSSKVVRNYI